MVHPSKFVFLIVFFCVMPKGFSDEVLTWTDCIDQAAQNQPELISASEYVVQSNHNQTIAASDRLPQITAQVKASTVDSKTSSSSKSFSYGLTGNQLVFDGFKKSHQIRAAAENIAVERESYRYVSSQVRWRLRTAFIELLKAQSLIEITEDIYKIRQQNLQLISLRYDSGMEHRGALLTAQANAAQAAFEIKSAKRSLQLAQLKLLKAMGRDQVSSIRATGDLALDFKIQPQPDFEVLVQAHPAYLKAVAQKNAAAYDLRASRSDFSPTVTLSGDLGKSGNSWPADQSSSGAGITVSLPLFEGGSRVAQLLKSKSVYRQLQADEKVSKDDILVSLQQAWNSLVDAIETIAVQQTFMQSALERSNIAQAEYSVGLISFDNWTIIQDELVRQKKSLLDAQANALLAHADWIQAKGETLEYAQ